MDAAKTLLRTTVRTFYPHPKQILIIDALLLHSVLHIEDLAVLLSTQPKDIRTFINPLRSARLLATHSRLEARTGSTRGVQRDYYYIPFHPAIDAVKYRIAKLRRKIEALYQQDETKRKDWRCPRCHAEYEELEILDKIGSDGFYCDRCGTTLVQNEAAAQERGNHEKIRRLNTQLAKFDEMIGKVDRVYVPENAFLDAWERKKDVPRRHGEGFGGERGFVELKREPRGGDLGKRQEVVDVKNLAVSLTSGAERRREEEEERERRKKELVKQNLLPVWHTNSAIGPGLGPGSGSGVKTEQNGDFSLALKKEEDADEKKVDVEAANMRDEVAAYVAEMEREKEEAARRAKEEDDEDDEDDDEGFEDVMGGTAGSVSNFGTPMGSQDISVSTKHDSDGRLGGTKTESLNGGLAGIKREFDSESGVSSDANTPASFGERDGKKVKFEHDMDGANDGGRNGSGRRDSDEDEDDEDFEDAI